LVTNTRSQSCKKYPYIHKYVVANFPHFNGTGSVYFCIRKSTTSLSNYDEQNFVRISRRNNEAHIATSLLVGVFLHF